VFSTGGISVGASGAIFGIIGALIAFCGRNGRDIEGLNYITILLWAVVGVAMGFMDVGVDNFAHLGGIATGLLMEWINIRFINKKDWYVKVIHSVFGDRVHNFLRANTNHSKILVLNTWVFAATKG